MEAAGAAEADVRVGVAAGVTATSAQGISARMEVAEAVEEVMHLVISSICHAPVICNMCLAPVTFNVRYALVMFSICVLFPRILVLSSCFPAWFVSMLGIMQSLMERCWLTLIGWSSSLHGIALFPPPPHTW